MLLVRDIMYCKPGKVKPLIKMFLEMNKLMEKHGMGRMRILSDFSGERFWTLVGEMEVEDGDLEKMLSMSDMPPEAGKEFEAMMKGYHDLVDHGRREIFRIEG
jgi:hypothetical protein